MNIKSNVIIFSMKDKEREDIRKIKEKKLQIVLDQSYNLPIFELNEEEYIKDTISNNLEKILGTSEFYIEQLYTWGDPAYYNEYDEIIVSYLAVINEQSIKNMSSKLNLYDLEVVNCENQFVQKVSLINEEIQIKYKIKTIPKVNRNNIDYKIKLVGKSLISELTAIIIHNGIKRLKNRIENTNIAFSFLEKEFTISELQQVYEIILGKKLVSSNFRKKVEPMIKKTDKVIKDSAFRPSKKYEFNTNYINNWV